MLCDLIIPADDRSGSATQAGVPEFMDDWIAFRKEQDGNTDLEAQILGGLMWLDARVECEFGGKTFADASADQQKQILDRIAWPDRAKPEDHRWVAFFNRFRDLTVSGFFSSKMGVADLPYLGNTHRDELERLPAQSLGNHRRAHEERLQGRHYYRKSNPGAPDIELTFLYWPEVTPGYRAGIFSSETKKQEIP